MKKRNMKLKKYGNIENMEEGCNIWCIRKVMEMNTINGLQKQGCLMQKRQLKIIGQEFRVETYKKGR